MTFQIPESIEERDEIMGAANLLYLGNGPVFQSAAKLDERFESWGLEVDRYWAFDGEFPDSPAGYDGIFLSGSPHGSYEDIEFIHREHEFIQAAAEHDIPMLGLCFGSQILASALCGRDQVFRRPFCEIEFKPLRVDKLAQTDLICADLGESVMMFVWHNDEVRAGHPDMRILATSDLCPNHIWRFREEPVWGIQGHPEITYEQALLWFEENRDRMTNDGADVDVLKAQAVEAAEAKTMLTRFAELIGGNP